MDAASNILALAHALYITPTAASKDVALLLNKSVSKAISSG